MKISILYKEDEKPDECGAIYNLSLDRCAAAFCPDSARADSFLYVVSRPLTIKDNIIYRQEILADFLAFPRMFDELKTIFLRYDKIKADWIELRSGLHATECSNKELMLKQSYSSLKATSVFPRTIMSFFRAISETLSKYDTKSEGLRKINKYSTGMLEDNRLGEITDISGLFIYGDPEDFSFDVRITLSEDMKITRSELIGIKPMPGKRTREKQEKQFEKSLREIERLPEAGKDSAGSEKEAGTFTKLLRGLTVKGVQSDNAVIDRSSDETVMDILSGALSDIDSALSAITGEIYEIFHGISSEIQFYDAAVRYCSYASDSGLSLTVPIIRPMEEDCMEFSGLKDLFLAVEGLSGDEIIPNDLRISDDTDGMLIRGSNNTGKTVFLRSVGTAQLLAQAGLPVCADNAVVSIKSAVFSHFSSAEEEFSAGDTAGRFEGEVRCVSEIIDNIKPYSLVLLNETFQTTSYSEGASGIFDILSVLPALKCRYIFVTHLLDLFDRFNGGKTMLMQTFFSGEDSRTSSESGKRYVLTPVAD